MAHPVVYFEILGTDGRGLRDFYERLFGWEITPVEGTEEGYQRIAAQEGGIAGGLAGFPGVPPQVNYYVRCDDLGSAVERAKELGGSVIMEPREATEGVEVAMVADPEGHTIGLIRGV